MKFELKQLIEHAEISVEKAKNNTSKLSESILNINGMTGNKTRHLYNNICGLSGANYFEIGTYTGTSLISSLFENSVTALAVDNWSEFNGPKEQFINNMNEFLPGKKYHFLEKDCFSITPEDIKNVFEEIDIYLYDGAHDYESQRKALTYFSNYLSKYSIVIIDDFRNDTPTWANVSLGTYKGIEESGLIIHHKIEIITHQESSGRSEFWNGFGLFVLENPNK